MILRLGCFPIFWSEDLISASTRVYSFSTNDLRMFAITPLIRYGDFEGGVRGNAFVSGGYVPAKAAGSTFNGVVR